MYAFRNLPILYTQYYTATKLQDILNEHINDEDEAYHIPVAAAEYISDVYKIQGNHLYNSNMDNPYTYLSTHFENPIAQGLDTSDTEYNFGQSNIGQYTGTVPSSPIIRDTQTTVYFAEHDFDNPFHIGVIHIIIQITVTFSAFDSHLHLFALQIIHNEAITWTDGSKYAGILAFPILLTDYIDPMSSLTFLPSQVTELNMLASTTFNNTAALHIVKQKGNIPIDTHVHNITSWVYNTAYIPLRYHAYKQEKDPSQSAHIITQAWQLIEDNIKTIKVPVVIPLTCYIQNFCVQAN